MKTRQYKKQILGSTKEDTSVLGDEYVAWFHEIKEKVRCAQIKAALAVNSELLYFYWQLGCEIIELQKKARWGESFLQRLSQDLTKEFPEVKGFSYRNLRYIRQWVKFWSAYKNVNWQQLVANLGGIPWGHNLIILSQCRKHEEALYYIEAVRKYGWSRNVLALQVESHLWQREGKAISNFSMTLPEPQSDLAKQTLKDPYCFDFLTLTKDYSERELENALIEHLSKFLLELGTGFAYIGRQVPIAVDGNDFRLDLLFYHTRLHCYVVVELKTGIFVPEYAGKINFYIKAVDEMFRNTGDNPTIGLLLCRRRNAVVAEWALSDIHKPVGISEYRLVKSLPKKFSTSLPSLAQIEAELKNNLDSKNRQSPKSQ